MIVRIVCKRPEDGARSNVRVRRLPSYHDARVLAVDDDGKEHELEGVTAVTWNVRPGEAAMARLEVTGVEIDAAGVLARSTHARASGRTTEMLRRALRIALAGERVLVLVVNRRDIDSSRRILKALGAPEDVEERMMIWPYDGVLKGELAGIPFAHVLEDHTVAEARERTWTAAKSALVWNDGGAPTERPHEGGETPPPEQSGGA